MEAEKTEMPPPACAGVDTRRDTHTLALLDAFGKVIGTRAFPTGADGYAALEREIGDPSVPVGVEGASSYGAGPADHLQAAGYEVYEMLRPKRSQRRCGKSDPIDAIAAARNLATGESLTPKARGGVAGDIGWLMVARERAVRQMAASPNCIDSIIVTAPDALRAKLGGESGEARIRKIAVARQGGVPLPRRGEGDRPHIRS